MPTGTDETWIAAFASGLGEDARHYGCPLLGGDTDHTPGPTSVSIAAFGTVPHGRMVRRSTAKVGDCVVVTGTIGDAALGVKVRGDAESVRRAGDLRQRWLPIWSNAISCRSRAMHSPRRCCSTRQRRWMSPTGLSGDLAKLCRASAVAAEIDVARVPLSDAARAAVAAEPALLETVLTGGDDYEIVLTLAPEKLAAFRAAADAAGVLVTEIGRVAKGEGARFLHEGKTLAFTRPAYSHF